MRTLIFHKMLNFSNIYSFLSITANTHSLDDFICMKSGKGPGTVYDLLHFVQVFYKTPEKINSQ